LRIEVELVIVFCDTSALMKLLVDEAQTDQIRQISTNADAIGVCRISWAETMAALARTEQRHHRPLRQSRLFRGKPGGPDEHGLSLG
jgi:predicted nucleic acid-binding protein